MTTEDTPWQANSNDSTHSVFSNEDVDNAMVGSQMYGFKRYLVFSISTSVYCPGKTERTARL